jgi:hypothetical protein
MNEVRVVSSLDSPLAIAEAFSSELRYAHRVCISSPWLQKCAVHLLKETLPKGAELEMLVGKPKPYDTTYRALETLDAVSREMQWKFNCVLAPTLHAKFATINNKAALLGSANVTNGGLYENKEVLLCLHASDAVEQLTRIFEVFKEQTDNERWELFRDYHGFSVDGTLVEITLSYLRRNHNKEVRIACLISEYRKRGYDFYRAKEGFQEIEKSGFIYTTTDGYVRLNPKYEL